MFKKKGTPTVVDVKPKTTKRAAPPLFAVNSIRPPQQAENCTVMISINVKTMRKSAEMLKKLFEGHGISTWICCQIKGGNDFRDEIVKAVKTCKVFLILMNNEWAASGECKDEFNLAKRLNLTSHETERTVSGQQRLPAIVPIAFPNLLWTGHAHVELLAANTNFLVHDNKDLVGKPADSLLRQLVQSVVDLNVKGISDNLGLRTLSASHHEEEVGGEASGSSEGVVERLAGSCDKEVHDVAQQLAKLSQQMLEVQNSLGDIRAASAKQVKQKQSPTVTVGPAQAVAQAAPAPELPNFDRMDPRHFRDQYLGMIVESYLDHRLSWSLELVIQKKSKPAKDHTIKFTGYIRCASRLSCFPFFPMGSAPLHPLSSAGGEC